MSNLKEIAAAFLREVSNDESWIDGSYDGFAHRKLTDLLSRMREEGAKAARDSDANHAALGAWRGAFDE